MERKIGEEFDYNGHKLKVLETAMGTCAGCVFMDNCHDNEPVVGACNANARADKRQVVFVEVAQTSDEEPQKQELNLCEVLSECPEGTSFWSPLLGDVKFWGVSESLVTVEDKAGNSWDINSDSTLTIGGIGGVTSEEPMLFPSRELRDWSKWECPKPKKPKFDPKTLKPFDEVLVRDNYSLWCCGLFSFLGGNNKVVTTGAWKYAVPYNDDTKHLLGTTDEAPEYYRYWED